MKKIVVVGDFISGSGLTGVIFNVFSAFPKDKYKIEVVGYGKDPSQLTDQKCAKLGWKMHRVVPVTKDPLAHWRWWKRFFKTNKYDIAYFNYSSSWNYLPIAYAKKYGEVKEIVCHSHNSYFSHTFSNPILMWLLTRLNNHGKKVFEKYTDKKIAVSPEAGRWMFGDRSSNVHTVANGRDLKLFSFSPEYRDEIRRKLKVPTQVKLIGFVGVLQDRKNPLFALKVFKKFHDGNRESKFLMIGKGPLKSAVTRAINEYGLTNDVIMIDFVEDMYRWYSALDALLFTSTYEGFSLVTIEAQISNLPILASSSNTEATFITDRIFKLRELNVLGWKDTLEKSLRQPFDRSKISPKLQKFSINTQVKEIQRIIG